MRTEGLSSLMIEIILHSESANSRVYDLYQYTLIFVRHQRRVSRITSRDSLVSAGLPYTRGL